MGEKLSVNPWTGIWVRPRETIRAILSYNKKYMLVLLYWLYGFPITLQAVQNNSLGTEYSEPAILVMSALVAFLTGFLGINITSWLFYKTGRWIGGVGSFHDLRAAVGWSSVPNIVAIALWAVQIAMFGRTVFLSMFYTMPLEGTQLTVIYLCSIVAIATMIWGFIILLKAVGEAQQFSAWKALLNVLLPIIVIVIALKLLTWLLMLFSATAH